MLGRWVGGGGGGGGGDGVDGCDGVGEEERCGG